jgi:hypothetical protein
VLHFSGHNAIDKFTVEAQNQGKQLGALQRTIDAFTHFVISKSEGALVLCDIQGILSFEERVLFNNMEFFEGIKDADGILTLFDLQGHSTQAYVPNSTGK